MLVRCQVHIPWTAGHIIDAPEPESRIWTVSPRMTSSCRFSPTRCLSRRIAIDDGFLSARCLGFQLNQVDPRRRLGDFALFCVVSYLSRTSRTHHNNMLLIFYEDSERSKPDEMEHIRQIGQIERDGTDYIGIFLDAFRFSLIWTRLGDKETQLSIRPPSRNCLFSGDGNGVE
jgi:hypothetical protein